MSFLATVIPLAHHGLLLAIPFAGPALMIGGGILAVHLHDRRSHDPGD